MDILLTKEEIKVLESAVEMTIDISLFNFTYLKYNFLQLKLKDNFTDYVLLHLEKLKTICTGTKKEISVNDKICSDIAKEFRRLWLTIHFHLAKINFEKEMNKNNMSVIDRLIIRGIDLSKRDNYYIFSIDKKCVSILLDSLNLFVNICKKDSFTISTFLKRISFLDCDKVKLIDELNIIFSFFVFDECVTDFKTIKIIIKKLSESF